MGQASTIGLDIAKWVFQAHGPDVFPCPEGGVHRCCMDRRCGRTEPDPCSGLCDADVLRASQLQHSVQHVGRDGHLDRVARRFANVAHHR